MTTEEHSFGIIPVKKQQGQWEVFVIKHRKGHWAFPKGHAHPDESALEAALRECAEETGFVVRSLLSGKPFVEHYQFRSDQDLIDKTVTYYLAQVEGTPHLQAEEVVEGLWMPLDQAMERVTFAEARQLLGAVEEELNRL